MPTDKLHKLKNLIVNRVALCPRGANPGAQIVLFKSEPIELNEWSPSYIDALPDDCFAAIEKGGTMDVEEKTTPRSLRHLPYKTKKGSVDPAHVKSAMARIPNTALSADLKASAEAKLLSVAKSLGIALEGTVPTNITKAMTTMQILAYRKAWDTWYDLKDAFMSSVSQIMYEGADAELLHKTVAEFASANKEISTTLESCMAKSEGALSVAGLFEQLERMVTKTPTATISELEAVFSKFETERGGATMPVKEISKTGLSAEVLKHIEDLEKATAGLAAIEKRATDAEASVVTMKAQIETLKAENVAANEKLSKAGIGPTEDEVKKSLAGNPTALAAYEATKKMADDAMALAKSHQENLQKAQVETLIEKSMKNIAGAEVAKIGELLLHARTKLDKADVETLENVLKTADAALKASELFKEHGTGGGETTEKYDQVLKHAEAFMKADPKLSKAQAVTKVYEVHPDLYE